MAPTLKHGGHRVPLDLPGLAAGAGSDTSTLLTYDFNYPAYGTYDYTTEVVSRATLTFDTNVVASATNNFGVSVAHYSVAGVLKNQVIYQNAAAGITATAFIPIDLTGPPAGNLTNPTGVAIQAGWQLATGDSIVVKRVSNGTGQASAAFTVTLMTGVYGS